MSVACPTLCCSIMHSTLVWHGVRWIGGLNSLSCICSPASGRHLWQQSDQGPTPSGLCILSVHAKKLSSFHSHLSSKLFMLMHLREMSNICCQYITDNPLQWFIRRTHLRILNHGLDVSMLVTDSCSPALNLSSPTINHWIDTGHPVVTSFHFSGLSCKAGEAVRTGENCLSLSGSVWHCVYSSSKDTRNNLEGGHSFSVTQGNTVSHLIVYLCPTFKLFF